MARAHKSNAVEIPAIDLDALTPEEEDQLLLEAERRFGSGWHFSSLEDLLTSEDGFGLTTATPLQRAICKIIQGIPLGKLADNKTVKRALGFANIPTSEGPPAEVVIVAAVRTAKSMIAAATAIWASQTCDLSKLREGEIPRYSILSLELDNARVVHTHLLGALQKPALKPLRIKAGSSGTWHELIDETGSDAVGSEFLWHPSHRPVEIRVIAGKRAGGSLVSRWSIGTVLDEAPRMVGSTEGVINYDDARRAVRARLLPGAQILSIGSPYQPYGPIYDIVQKEWGEPTESRVVIKANGPSMNPYWWTPDRCEEIRVSDPTVYQTDVKAEFADGEETLFPQQILKNSTRTSPAVIDWERGHDYCAAMDPATRGNAWALVVCDRVGRKKRVVYCQEWRGTTLDPLSPRRVLQETAEILKSYKLGWAYTDQWSADANKDLGFELGLHLIVEDWTAQGKINAFTSLATNLADGQIELSPDKMLQRDLRLVKKKATQRGPSIHLPSTNDGRHCDYAPAVARCLFRWIQEDIIDPPKPGEDGYWRHWEQQMIEQEEAAFKSNENAPFWAKDPYTGEVIGDE